MSQPPQTGKRIVSKGEYVVIHGVKLSIRLFAICMVALQPFFYLALVWLSIALICRAFIASTWKEILWTITLFGPVILICSLGLYYVEGLWKAILDYADRVDAGVPLTRANTAALPAHESLVRAGAEPVQEQQAVLLRAAAQTQERHKEQLVRASERGMEQT